MPPARGRHSRGHDPVDNRSERGFTIIELVVVMVVVAAILAIAAPAFRSAGKGIDAPASNGGAGIVWRAMQQHRQNNHGRLPGDNEYIGARAGTSGFRDAAGNRLIAEWPTASSGEPMGLATAWYRPTSNDAGNVYPPRDSADFGAPVGAPVPGRLRLLAPGSTLKNAIVLSTTADSTAGWMAAYGPTGRLVYLRGINRGPAGSTVEPVEPIG